jgi:orotate phosphoribosyltransferase
MSLFNLGDFTLSGGAKANWKIDCDALTEDDWITLASLVRELVPLYSSVEGVPGGGTKLAKHLARTCTISGPHLIVDDVLTTGESVQKALDLAIKSQKPVVGVVIFARGQCPAWIKPIFQMPEVFWTKPRTR